MKKLLMLFLAFFFSVSTCQKKEGTNTQEQIMIVTEDTLTRYQLDSLFMADELSFNIKEDWIESSVLNQDKNDILYKYVYIKELTDSTGTVYTLYTYQDSLYIINKRVVE